MVGRSDSLIIILAVTPPPKKGTEAVLLHPFKETALLVPGPALPALIRCVGAGGRNYKLDRNDWEWRKREMNFEDDNIFG